MKYESLEKEKTRFLIYYSVIKERKGMQELLKYLEDKTDYFTAPASIYYHGNFKGGLLYHSNNVTEIFIDLIKQHKMNISFETCVVCGLFHDVCKIDMYILNDEKFVYKKHDGHAKRSLEILNKFIKLSDEERNIIKYHMGYYNTKEFSEYNAEYDLQELCGNNFETAVFHYADMFASRCWEDKK